MIKSWMNIMKDKFIFPLSSLIARNSLINVNKWVFGTQT